MANRDHHKPLGRPPLGESLPILSLQWHRRYPQRRASAPAAEYSREPMRKNPVATYVRLLTRRFVPTFILLYGAKTALVLASSARKGKASRRTLFNKDTFQFAIAHSAFAVLYRSVKTPLERYLVFCEWHQAPAKSAAAFFAAVASSLAISLDRNVDRRKDIAIYVAIRAAHFCLRSWLVNWKSRKGRLIECANTEFHADGTARNVSPLQKMEVALEQLFRRRGDILALMVILGQITYAVNLMPQTLPADFFNYLVRIHRLPNMYGSFAWSYLDLTCERIRDLTRRPKSANCVPTGFTSAEFVPRLFQDEAAKRGIASLFPRGIRHDYVACALQHPQTVSCAAGALGMALQVFHGMIRASAFFYAVTMAVSYLLSAWKLRRGRPPPYERFRPNLRLRNPTGEKRAANRQQATVRRYVEAILRSSSWTALFIFLGRYSLCILRRLRDGKEAASSYALAGAVGALGGLLEREGRRVDILMFLFMKGVESMWNCGIEWRWWKGFRHGEIALHAVAIGVIMTLYERDRKTFKTGHGAITRKFGNLLRNLVG